MLQCSLSRRRRHKTHDMIFTTRKKPPQTATPPPLTDDDQPYVLASLAAGCGAALGLLFVATVQRFIPGIMNAALPGFLLGLLPFQLMACGAAALTLRARVIGQSLRTAMGLPDALHLPWSTLGRVLTQLLALYPILIAINLAVIAVCQHFGWPMPEQALTQYARQDCSTAFWVVAALGIVLIAPVCEELLFRQVIFRSIRYFRPGHAGIWTALLFSLFHGLPQYAPALFVLGLFLQRARSEGGLAQAIVLHSVFNLISLLLIVLRVVYAPGT